MKLSTEASASPASQSAAEAAAEPGIVVPAERPLWVRRFATELHQKYNPRHALKAIVAVPAFHEPIIDGIRAIAICWVLSVHLVLYHVGLFPQQALAIFDSPWLHFIARGDLGVDLFFVISGYLIGNLLFGEFSKTGSLRLRRFYIRRFLRLIPAYIAAMAADAVGPPWFPCVETLDQSPVRE